MGFHHGKITKFQLELPNILPEKHGFSVSCRWRSSRAEVEYSGRLFQKAYCGAPSKDLIPGTESGAL